jgi:hypothetical protein
LKLISFTLFFLSCSSYHFNDFKNLRYESEWASENSILLKDGNGLEQKTNFTLLKPLYSGKYLGKTYFALVLVTSPPGSGVFRDLAIFTPSIEGVKQVKSFHLGDRVKVKKVFFEGEFIMVTMLTHAKSDPMCCPSLLVTKKYPIEKLSY